MVPIQVNGFDTYAVVDTGADATVISMEVAVAEAHCNR